MKLLLIFLILTTTILSSCTPSSNGRRATTVSSADGEQSESGDEDSSLDEPESLTSSWIVGGQTITSAIFNSDETASFYLQGNGIELIAQDDNNALVCLVINYINSSTSLEKQLRIRASRVKLISNNQYVYRVLPSSSADNGAVCGGSAALKNSVGTTLKVVTTGSAYSFSEVCPTCNSTIVSTNIQLYATSGGQLGSELSANTNYFTGLNIRINPNNDVSDNNSSCTNNGCQASGFDCCLEGQCVNDGELKSNPSSTDLVQALVDVADNPQNFKKWPTVYYVCSGDTGNPIDPDDGNEDPDPTDPYDEAREQLESDIADYKCLNEDVNFCDPDFNTVREEVWIRCGCLVDPITNDPLDPRCPDYNLKKIEDEAGNIVKIECKIPEDTTNPTPFQDVNISVSARTAPHRYFDTNGINYDNLSDIPSGIEQEGEVFSYTNDSAKTGPSETTFSMNAILGQFALDQALPATVIDLEHDTAYVIRANSGVYSPCESCARDPWYNAFNSHPEINSPFGLYSINYTTSRDNYFGNETRGNYEDTIFGRACWVPPTMIPFSHYSYVDVDTQRRSRLKTQAAMWVNGYQRDWYGFNKGALIGSFDGSNWFAIGSGRRVKSTTKKLFLAINAPFADLAAPTSYNVSVMEDRGIQDAAEHDYDFDIDPNAVHQNPAGSCQLNHQCETDTDCVTKLGWEYACADISNVKSYWPKYNIDSQENAATARELKFNNIITGGLTGTSNKRCVYRGAGSICKLDYTTESNTNTQKLLACAPNFSCQPLSSGSFNKETVRTPNDPTNDLFGQSANILGRLPTYFGANENLDTEVRTNISNNTALAFGGSAAANQSTFGLCVPGRDTSAINYEDQHSSNNISGVDHISQIGACDYTQATAANRMRACPTFDTDGDLIRTGGDSGLRIRQNACGVEFTSVFDNLFTILSLGDSASKDINEKGFANNACFRRAGSPCHTDYDCAPNNLHAEYALNRSINDFGGTKAEYEFWQESLVCRQRDTPPTRGVASLDDYYNFDMSKNRCCREIDNDFTMYTDYENGSDLADYESDNDLLDTTLYTYDNPTANGRYSRYIVADDISGAVQVDSTSIPTTTNKENMWKKINKTGSANCCGGGFIRKFADGTNDWTRPNRLLIDPTNFQCLNYTNTLYKESPNSDVEGQWFLDSSKFCFSPTDDENIGGVQKFGCIQTSFEETTDFAKSSFTGPDYDHTGTPAVTFEQVNLEYAPEDTDTGNGNITLSETLGKGAIYFATAYTDGGMDADNDGTLDGYNQTYLNELYRFRDHSNFNNESTPAVTAPNVSGIYGYQNSMKIGFILPVYADISSGIDIKVHFRGDSISNPEFSSSVSLATEATCKNEVNSNETQAAGNSPADLGSHTYLHALSGSTDVAVSSCYYEDTARKRYILLISLTSDDSDNDEDVTDWDYAWPELIFNSFDTNTVLSPGESMHYLNKLGEYELLGIPQITYEPLFCNDVVKGRDFPSDRGTRLDEEKVVPGFYSSSIESHQDYNSTISYDGSTPEGHFKEDNFALTQIFSAHDFKCCAKLGSKVVSGSKCCTNYANNNIDGNLRCSLPSGTNLTVYFNKFVSSEADIEELDTGVLDEELALEDSEFDENGAPKQTASTRSKLESIGQRFCQNNSTRPGVAFDYYVPEPNNSGQFLQNSSFDSFYSILDSSGDIATDGSGGFTTENYGLFTNGGYKWNHHIYCN